MGKKRVFLYGAALVLAGCVGLAGFRLASGQELYKAPELTLLEGQANFDLLEGIEYDAGQYELRVDDDSLDGFDVNRLGEYWVGYVLTPKAGEQGELLPVAQAAEVPDADPASPPDGDPEFPVEPQDPGTVETEPPVEPQDPGAVETEPPVEPQDPGAVETEPPVEPQDPGAAETESPVEPQDPGAVATEPPVESQDPDAVETEFPLETLEPETVRFQRRVIVISALNEYKETVRMELGTGAAAAAAGITAKTANYNIQVVRDGFNPDEVGEYRVTFCLNHGDTPLRQFERWVQVTKPGVDFEVDEEPLVAPKDPAAAELEMDFWLSGITYDETRYTLVLRDDPAALIPNWAEPQRLEYGLWEGDPNALPAGDAAPAMYADPAAGDIGPAAGDAADPSTGDGDLPAPELAAVFGRDVYTTGELEEEPKQSEKPEDRTLAIVAPPLVIYLEDVDPDNPKPIDLLDGVEVIDEATGDPVEAVVAVSDPRDLLDAVVDNTGGSGLLSGGMGDPGMDGPGPGAGDPVPAEPENTGYNILDPTALTEGEYEVELTAADPETGELITGVRAVSVQPRASVPTGTGFAIGFSDPDSYDTVNGVVWVDYHMTNNGYATDPIWDLDKIHPTLKSAIDEFNTILSPNGYTDPDTGRRTYQAINTDGHLTIYLFGSYTLTQADVDALKNFQFTKKSAPINNPSAGNTGVYLSWANAELRFHNANSNARLSFGNTGGLELPTGVNLPQGFYWNVNTTGIKYIAGTGRNLTMAPREYGNGYLVLTGGPKANNMTSGASYSQGSNMTYQGSNMSGQTGNAGPKHKVASGLLFVNPTAAGTVTSTGALNLTVNNSSNMDLDVCAGHAMIHAAYGPPAFIVQQNGAVTVTMNGSTGTPDIYLGFSNQRANPKVKLTNTFTINLSGGAKLGNIYPNRMSCNNGGDYDGEITAQPIAVNVNGNVTVTGGIYGFSKLDVNADNTLTCGRLDYSQYGLNDGTQWGDLRLWNNSSVILKTTGVDQKVRYLSPKGTNTTLAVPTPNNNNGAPTPLLVSDHDDQDLSSSRRITLKGSEAGYTGRSHDVILRFNNSAHANRDHYRLGSTLTTVREVRANASGEVYLYAPNWTLWRKQADGTYTQVSDYPTLAEALNDMRTNATLSSDWRINLEHDYTLTATDTSTLRSLAIPNNVTNVTFVGKPGSGTGSPRLTVPGGANEFRMPGWGYVQFVMTDFSINDNTGGSGFYIAAEGSPLTIEGTWAGTATTHLCGGYVGTGGGGGDSYSIAGNQHFIVRNSGTGWASIAGGHCFNRTSGTLGTGTMTGAVALEVDAKGWGTTYGITLGNSYMGTVVGQTVMNGGGRLTLKGNLTSGPVSHVSITKNMNVSGNDSLGADATIELNGVTLGSNVIFNEYNGRDLVTGLTGNGKLILSAVENSTLGADCKVRSFDQMRVSAGKKLTLAGDGGWVDYKNRAGRLILHNGSTVELQKTSQAEGSTLKVKSVELPDGSAAISFAKVGNQTYAPVWVKDSGTLTVTQAGAKLNLRYYGANTAAVDDTVLRFDNQGSAIGALAHLTPDFDNSVVLVRPQNSGLIKVSVERVALDTADANGNPTGTYAAHPSLAAALASLKTRKAESPHWRVSLMGNYEMTAADHQALEELDNNNALDGVQTVYLAGRRGSSGTINGLTITAATNGTKHLNLPLDNTSQRARIVLKDFVWDNGTDRCAIVAQGRALTIEGQWSGTTNCHVGGGVGYYSQLSPDSLNTKTHYGTTDVTVRNTGSGWASIVGGNVFIKDGSSNTWASSTVTGATRVTVHASWPIGLGITPGSLCQGYDCEVTLGAGGTATITGRLERGSYTADGKTIQGHITHFGLATTVRVRTFTANGDVTINLGSSTAAFSTTGDLPVNVAKHGNYDILSRTNTVGDSAYPKGSGELIVSINGETTIPADSQIKTFDKLVVSTGKKLILEGDGGWVNYNGRAGQLILHSGSTVEFRKRAAGQDSVLKTKGIELPDGSATISFPRIGSDAWGPVLVQGTGGLTAQNNYELNLKYYPDTDTAQARDTVLKFEDTDQAAAALPHLTPRFANSAYFTQDGTLIRVGTERIVVDRIAADGTATELGRHATMEEALSNLRANHSLSQNWRVSLLMDYQVTQADLTMLKNLNTNNGLNNVQRITIAGRRQDTGAIHTLTMGSTLATKILCLPEGSAGPEFILKDFNVAGGPGAIVANGRRLTVDGAWNGNDLWYVAGGKADWYEAAGDTALTYTGATNLTVRNTGSGWAAIAGGNLIARGNGGTQQTADGTGSSTVGATNLTVHASWGTHFGITPGCLYIGCNVGTTTLTAGGTATLTGRVAFGHIAHFAATDRTAVGACDLRGNAVINLGSAPADFTIGSNAEMNVKTQGAINGGGKLILSVNGACTVEDGSNVMKTFDELRVSQNQTLTFAGDGGWIKHNNRDGLLVLEEGSTLKLSRIGGNVGSALHVRGIQLNGNANLQYPRMNGKDFAPLVVDSGGTLTAATGRKLRVSYLDNNNQADIGDCLLYFVDQGNANGALPYVEKGFANASSVALFIENGVIKVGLGSVLLTWMDGSYGKYFSTLKEALEDFATSQNADVGQGTNGRRIRSRITFVEDYTLTEDDMNYLASIELGGTRGGGSYSDSMLRLTSQFTAGSKVTNRQDGNWPVPPDSAALDPKWEIYYPTPAGTAAGATVRRTVTIPADPMGTVSISLGDCNYYLKDIDLRFEGSTEIFANGNYFEATSGVNMVGGNYPTLYGGGESAEVRTDRTNDYGNGAYNAQGNTELVLNSGTWQAVYGGGKADTARVPGSTSIAVNGAGLASGGAVYGGGNAGHVDGSATVTINSGTATSGTGAIAASSKIVAGGYTGNVTGTATLNINGGLSSAQVTLQGVERGTAGNTSINVSLNNLPQTASLVTLNVYAGPETEANMTGQGNSGNAIASENAITGGGSVNGTGTVTIRFDGQYRPKLGTVCGLLKPLSSGTATKGALNLINTMTVQDICFFDNLNIGQNNSSTGTVTVTGRLDSDPHKNLRQGTGTIRRWPFDRTGTLTLWGETRINLPDGPTNVNDQTPNKETGEAKVGRLVTSGNQAHLHIGRKLDTTDAQGRGTGATNPLYVTQGNYSANLTVDTLRVGTPQGRDPGSTPLHGEILLSFPRALTGAQDPQKSHYRTDTAGWNLDRSEGQLSAENRAIAFYLNAPSDVTNIIYAKSVYLIVEAVAVRPTRMENTNLVNPTDPTHQIGWTVDLEMKYYKDNGAGNMILDTSVTTPPESVYVDTSPDADATWAAGGAGVTFPATSLDGTDTAFTAKAGELGTYTATLTIPPQAPFTYDPNTTETFYYVHGRGTHNGVTDVRNIVLDLHAPQLTADVTSTSNGQGSTEFTISANDVMPPHAPAGTLNAHGEEENLYSMSNLTLMGWSAHQLTDPADVDAAYFQGLEAAGQGKLLFESTAGVQNNTERTFTVNKADLPDKPDNSGKVDTVFLYLKDRLGNTRIHEVALSEHQLDLIIPTRVGVVLVKNGTRTLSPVCKITNMSMPYVKVELAGYTNKDDNQHSLGQTPSATTIGLAIGNSGEADSIGKNINVHQLPYRPYTSPPTDGFTGGLREELAILGPDSATDLTGGNTNRDHTLTFKFHGDFNGDAELSEKWDLFYLTYRFSVTSRPADAGANP